MSRTKNVVDNLALLRPDSLAEVTGAHGGEPLWQQRKSLATRNAVLDAALQCLAECGFGGCSLQTVAKYAGISRGAMLHHYASKLELMGAVIEYAFYRRMSDFIARIRALTDGDRIEHSAGIRVSYEVSQTPEYKAYIELHVASRTDPELRAIFLERASLYDAIWRKEIENAFPEWAADARLGVLNDYVWVMVEGLALNTELWGDPARTDALIDLVTKTMIAIRAGQLTL